MPRKARGMRVTRLSVSLASLLSLLSLVVSPLIGGHMAALRDRLALHARTLQTTPLPEVLRIARATGWNGIELRWADYARTLAAGHSKEDVIELLRACGLPLVAMGAKPGWMWADGDEGDSVFQTVVESCDVARALGCPTVASAADDSRGDVRRAAARVREAGEVAAAHGLRLALQFNSAASQLNNLKAGLELLDLADHPACGLLLDVYHLIRSGSGARGFAHVPAERILHVQYSDVPNRPPPAGVREDRLPLGEGVVPFRGVFGLLEAKGYAGWLSYEVPNAAVWARDAAEVAREGLERTRAVLA